MKKALIALTVVIIVACSSVSLAENNTISGYSQDDGWQYINIGEYVQTSSGEILPIIWRILSVDQNEAYLVSEYVLLNHRIDPDDKSYDKSSGDFTLTEMYSFLNSDFLSNFTDDEISLFVDKGYGAISLLTSEDLNNEQFGFVDNESRKGFGTEYAIANGLFQYSYRYGGSSPYWTRSQSSSKGYAARCTKQEGNLGWIRVVVENLGCRPACYVNLDLIENYDGEGTIDNPFNIIW